MTPTLADSNFWWWPQTYGQKILPLAGGWCSATGYHARERGPVQSRTCPFFHLSHGRALVVGIKMRKGGWDPSVPRSAATSIERRVPIIARHFDPPQHHFKQILCLYISRPFSLLSLNNCGYYLGCSTMSRVQLQKIHALTFYKDALTAARRADAIPQLTCIGKACKLYQPDAIQCTNAGGLGTDVDWKVRPLILVVGE